MSGLYSGLAEAWNKFCVKRGLNMYVESENNKPISKAFMAGWFRGLGSLNGRSE